MFSTENLNNLLKGVMAKLNTNVPCKSSEKNENGNGCSGSKIHITPSQALVIGGILGGVLDVDSVLIDRNQIVQIVLVGSLKEKSDLEKMLDKIGSMPFDEVVKAMLGRL